MKTGLFALLLLSSTGAIAQCCPYINEVTILPENPGAGEVVKIATFISTPNQGHLIGHGFSVNGTTIDADACYFNGLPTVITPIYDTIVIGLLEPGTYSLNFTASISPWEEDCVPENSQSQQFTFSVGYVAGIPERKAAPLVCYPNPAQETLFVEVPQATDEGPVVRSMDGRLMNVAYEHEANGIRLALSELAPGTYVLQLGDRRTTFVRN